MPAKKRTKKSTKSRKPRKKRTRKRKYAYRGSILTQAGMNACFDGITKYKGRSAQEASAICAAIRKRKGGK